MAIDRSGEWWTGTSPTDIREYLFDYTAGDYPIGEFRSATCDCGSEVFNLDVDENEGTAQRTCTSCNSARFLVDSSEYWDDAEPERCACPCGGEAMNIGVGFSLRDDKQDIKWLYIGCRCVKCGMLGSYADWKIDYSPSLQLLEQV